MKLIYNKAVAELWFQISFLFDILKELRNYNHKLFWRTPEK